MPKLIRWCACFDTHGDELDLGAAESFKEFVGWFKPDIRVHGGDCWDFRWLRRSAGDDEKAADVAGDFEAGLDFLKWYKPTAFLWGNHDDRLRRLLDSTNGAQRELAGQWLDRISVALSGVDQRPYCRRRGVYRIADHVLVHGYGHGEAAAKAACLAYNASTIMGHTHRIDMVRVAGIEDRYAYTAGCLCNLDMDYVRPNLGTLKHAHGWVYGVIANRRLVVWQARRYGNVWVLPSEVRTLN